MQTRDNVLAHRNRSDFCDLRLRCPSHTPEIARSPREEKAMLHCDLRVRWKVASDLRFRAAISEPKTLSFCGMSGDLAPSMRKSLAIAIVRFWCAKHKVLQGRPRGGDNFTSYFQVLQTLKHHLIKSNQTPQSMHHPHRNHDEHSSAIVRVVYFFAVLSLSLSLYIYIYINLRFGQSVHHRHENIPSDKPTLEAFSKSPNVFVLNAVGCRRALGGLGN